MERPRPPCSLLHSCEYWEPLTFLDEADEEGALFSARPNQCGNPWLKLKPPGGRRSSSVALTVSELNDPVLYVYVVKGVTSGWKMSLTKVIEGGKIGYLDGNEISKRSTAGA